MPTIVCTATSGQIQSTNSGLSLSPFFTTRAGGGGTTKAVDLTDTADLFGYVFSSSGAGGVRIWRTFYSFDVSSITSAPSAATIDLNVTTASPSGDFIILKGDEPGSTTNNLVANDFTSGIVGCAGKGAGNSSFESLATAYSSDFTLTSTGAAQITLNSTALTDIGNDNIFTIVLLNHDYDYKRVNPGISSGYVARVDGISDGVVANRPTLNYTAAATGYANSIMGVASANIGSVIGVATANIDKINGV